MPPSRIESRIDPRLIFQSGAIQEAILDQSGTQIGNQGSIWDQSGTNPGPRLAIRVQSGINLGPIRDPRLKNQSGINQGFNLGRRHPGFKLPPPMYGVHDTPYNNSSN